ncbi:MAG: hypothetical protein GY762_20405 [Proteobacteria bacterium]|nr:hypothetical protein [Pseudomonadota bacterium]
MSVLSVVPLLALLAVANAGPAKDKPTVDPAVVAIDSVRIVLERKDTYMRVQQSFRLGVGKGIVFHRDKGYGIPLPQDAWGARILGGEEMPFEVMENRVLIKEPITSQGLGVTISFNLPIENSTMVLKQQFGVPVADVQVYSNWTKGSTKLEGRGLAPAEQRESNNGLLVLFTFGRNLEDGQVLVTLSGLSDSVQGRRAMWTIVLSIAVLVVGLFLWLRRRNQTKNYEAA